jgi:alpha-galactosidase
MVFELDYQGQKIAIGEVESHPIEGGFIAQAPKLTLNLPSTPKRFYRHGWQSWTLAAWIDPAMPVTPISAPEFRAKDEDPLYAFAENHTSAWVGAVELADNTILLLGSLDLRGRVELDGTSLTGFFENGSGDWFMAMGEEDQVFKRYAQLLGEKFGTNTTKPLRVWCSWYSLYNLINEKIVSKVINDLGNLPFDVIQLDDGWQLNTGDWEANKKFPSGMAAMAESIQKTGRIAGLWLSPFITTKSSGIFHDHPDWILRDDQGKPVFAGIKFGGPIYPLDVSHPAVLDWLEMQIRKVRAWGYKYLKLDFLYAGAFPGKHYLPGPREEIYRQALRVMRNAAGNAYLLVCGAPIIPSLGLCDGMRIGPDVTPYWLNVPMSVYVNNPNHPSTQNAIRTSLNRIWLKEIVQVDPDVVFFRSKINVLNPHEKVLLRDLGEISGFKATSDLPQWLSSDDKSDLIDFLTRSPNISRLGRYQFQIDGREVDFSSAMLLPNEYKFPDKLASVLGLVQMARREVIPAIVEVLKQRYWRRKLEQ